MAFILIQLEVPNQTEGSLTDKVYKPGKVFETVSGLINILDGYMGGEYDCKLKLALNSTTDNAASITSDVAKVIYFPNK